MEVALSGYRDIVRRWLVKTGGYECQVRACGTRLSEWMQLCGLGHAGHAEEQCMVGNA